VPRAGEARRDAQLERQRLLGAGNLERVLEPSLGLRPGRGRQGTGRRRQGDELPGEPVPLRLGHALLRALDAREGVGDERAGPLDLPASGADAGDQRAEVRLDQDGAGGGVSGEPAVHLGQPLVATVLGQRPAPEDGPDREVHGEAVLRAHGDRGLGPLARRRRLPARLVDEGGEGEREGQAEGVGQVAGQGDGRRALPRGAVGEAEHPLCPRRVRAPRHSRVVQQPEGGRTARHRLVGQAALLQVLGGRHQLAPPEEGDPDRCL
jgi:hypothetical protein